MNKKSSVDWKKFGLCFLFAVVFTGGLVAYMELRPPKTEHVVMWSLQENYMFAVDAPYDGDVFKAGTYHFYQDNVIEPGKAKAWDIYVSDRLPDNTSKLSDMQYIGIVGTYESEEVTVDIPKGKYVYIKYRGGENFQGSLEVYLTPQ